MSTTRNSEVMAMVEEAIRENPEISNEQLQERASKLDPEVGELTPRSFNARYPLQVKRRLSAEKSQEEATDEPPNDGLRSRFRTELLNFAKDVVSAQDRGKVIDVVMEVDEYVDRVIP